MRSASRRSIICAAVLSMAGLFFVSPARADGNEDRFGQHPLVIRYGPRHHEPVVRVLPAPMTYVRAVPAQRTPSRNRPAASTDRSAVRSARSGGAVATVYTSRWVGLRRPGLYYQSSWYRPYYGYGHHYRRYHGFRRLFHFSRGYHRPFGHGRHGHSSGLFFGFRHR